MRLIFLFFLLVFFTACKRELSVQDSTQPAEQTPEESTTFNQTRFSLENATVYEKSGSKEQVNEVLDVLYYLDLLKEEDFKSLKVKNDQDSLKGNFEIIKSCKNSYSFYTPFFSKTFPHFYHDILKHIITTRENLPLKNYKIQEATDSITGIEIAFISFDVENKTYSTKVVNDTSVASIDETFYKVINNVLADKRDSSRYYLARKIMVYDADSNRYYSTDKYEYSLIKLNEAAALTLHQYPNVIDLSSEEHRIPVSEVDRNELIAELKASKFFSKLSDEEFLKLKKVLGEKTIYDVRDIFYYASPIRTCISPVVEDYSQPYKSVLLKLKKLSNGKFKPSDIIDNYQPNTVTEIAFKLNNKIFSISLQNGYQYIDVDGLVSLVNAAMNQEEINGNFYLLNNPDTNFCYIFMDKKQVEAANRLLKSK